VASVGTRRATARTTFSVSAVAGLDRAAMPSTDDMSLVVYADFTNPHSYLASRRVDALRTAGVAVDWRAVESLPYLPVTGGRDAARLAELARQHDEVARLLVDGEELPGGRPGFVANTQAAVSAYAEAYGAGVADDVRRLLFALYWQHGVDIGNPNALRTPLAGPILRGSSQSDPLRRFGYAVSVARGPITTSAWRRIRAWRSEWQQLGPHELPAVLEDSAPVLSGTAALRHLADKIERVDAKPSPGPAGRASHPQQTVRPPLGWASETGGVWGRPGWPTSLL
jgi:DSBA-like thioredoxin domain-containing protein